tara:strand:+ start:369 stop:1103 length:735 start_codon:yes stop_codon:yes gene_type:complete
MRKTVCIYVGANVGLSVSNLAPHFDELHIFEPDPEIFANLLKNLKSFTNIFFNNVACSHSKGTEKLYIYENRVSTSLGQANTDFYPNLGKPIKSILIETINLLDYILDKKLEKIDLLVTDAQGADLSILNTLKPLIINSKINQIMSETHGHVEPQYKEFNNEFKGFENLLKKNYHLQSFSLDGNPVIEIPETAPEFDTMWILKTINLDQMSTNNDLSFFLAPNYEKKELAICKNYSFWEKHNQK